MTRRNARKNTEKTGDAAGTSAKTATGAKEGDPESGPSKLERLVAQLARPQGATLAELTAATGWQAHSVRGALAGSLKKKGHVITSEKVDGVRRYRIAAAQ